MIQFPFVGIRPTVVGLPIEVVPENSVCCRVSVTQSQKSFIIPCNIFWVTEVMLLAGKGHRACETLHHLAGGRGMGHSLVCLGARCCARPVAELAGIPDSILAVRGPLRSQQQKLPQSRPQGWRMDSLTWGMGHPSPGELREVSAAGGLGIQYSLGLEEEGQWHTTHSHDRRRNQVHGTVLRDTFLPNS